jgi:hypothetical protein
LTVNAIPVRHQYGPHRREGESAASGGHRDAVGDAT